MEDQNLSFLKKITVAVSANKKLLVLASIVLTLVMVVIFSNVYGRTQKNIQRSIQSKTKNVLDEGVGPTITDTTQRQDLSQDQSVVWLLNYIDLIKAGKLDDSQKYVSEYVSGRLLNEFNISLQEDGVSAVVNVMKVEYTSNHLFSLVTLEVSQNIKSYYRFTMRNIDDFWQVYFLEKI